MLTKIFSTQQREKILDYILSNPSKGYRVRELSKNFRISVGSVSQFLSLLKKYKILKRKGDVFYIDMENPLTKAVKIILNIFKIDITHLKKVPDLLGIGIYGSWANGTNREDSDIDIWVKVKKRAEEELVAEASSKLNKRMKRNVQLQILDPGKIELLKKEDPIFYYSLVYGSVVLYGESLTD